ncbi:MAG: hypothetical protein AAFP26_14860, partial [Planctomycetota bacterium]
EYHAAHETVGSLTTAFDANYTYTATATERAEVTNGATWTERELAFSLAPGALKTITGTNPVLKDPNVTGRNVTLKAAVSVGETIGSNQSAANGGLATAGISFRSDTDPSALTLDQRVALASAERSDLVLQLGILGPLPANATAEQAAAHAAALAKGLGTVAPTPFGLGTEPPANSVAEAALNAAALGLYAPDQTTLRILSKRPVNFDTDGALNLEVTATPDGTLDKGTANVASRGSVELGTLDVTGETRVKVYGDITNAATSDVNTGNLTLEAAQAYIAEHAVPAHKLRTV